MIIGSQRESEKRRDVQEVVGRDIECGGLFRVEAMGEALSF